jgi:hypothetical protein
MNIIFDVHEPPNVLHVLDSLSERNSKAKQSIRYWYEAWFGPSEMDRKMAERYGVMRKTDEHGGLDDIFLSSTTVEEAVENSKYALMPPHFAILRMVVNHFQENLHVMYEANLKNLMERREHLTEEAKNFDWDVIFSDVATFYSAMRLPEEVYSHLLLNTCDGYFGGSADGYGRTTLEPSYLGKSNRTYFLDDLSIVGHEIAHLIEKEMSNERRKILEENSSGLMVADIGIIKEAVNRALFPGFLSLKYGLKKEDDVKSELEKYRHVQIARSDEIERRYAMIERLTAMLYEVTASHIRYGRSIFEDNYIENAIESYKSLKSELALIPVKTQ